MSRVSEALRRAGYQVDPGGQLPPHDPSFEASEDRPNDSGAGLFPPVEPDPAQRVEAPPAYAAPPAYPVREAPIDVGRKREGEEIRIQEAMRVLYRRRWLMAVTVLLALGVALAYNVVATRIYEGQARVLIEPTSDETVPFRTAGEDPARLDYFLTQLDILHSQALARRTLEGLHLLDANAGHQIEQITDFLESLAVTTTRSTMGESRVVNVTYRSPDAKVAARNVNTLAQTYVDQNLESRREQTRLAAARLNQRLSSLRDDVNAAEGALQNYREQKDAVSLNDGQNIVVQKLAQLNASLTSARAERVEKQALYEQLAAIQQSGAPLDTFPPVGGNTFIQGVKAELAALQRERSQLAERLGDLHPDMIKIKTEIESAQNRLNAETTKVVEGIQNDYRSAQAKERGLALALDIQEREVTDLNRKAIGYNALQRDALTTQQMFNTMLQRAKETEVAGELQTNNVKVLDYAQVPTDPIWPRTWVNVAVALIGGAFLGLVLVFGIQLFDPRIDDPEDIAEALGFPLLGVAPQVSGMSERSANLTNLPFPFQEAIRSVRTQLLLSNDAETPRTFVVTSTSSGEGKTMIASNLAVAMAMTGRRVLLVDADLRRPQMHAVFDIPRTPGLSDVISGDARPTEALSVASVKGLFVLPVGLDVQNAADLLDSDRLSPLIQSLRQVFDVVVIDCPPVMAVADAAIVANAATSVIFVIGSGTTSREAAQEALARLAAVHAHVLGIVLNKAKLGARSAYSYQQYADAAV